MLNYIDFLHNNYNMSDQIGVMKLHRSGIQNQVRTVGSLALTSPERELDCYMSMNPLRYRDKCIHRDKDHISRLKWLYVDLDYYHTAYKNHTKRQIIGLLEMDFFNKSIPEPSYIIDSGRGLYLLWKIDEHTKAYPRWATMQKYLCSTLAEFGSDPKVATDSARVLRKIGSINSKTNTEVCILQEQDRSYSLTNLMREYIESELPSKKMEDYAKSIAEILQIDLPDMTDRAAVRKFIRDNKEPANLFYQMKKSKKQMEQKKEQRERKAKIRWISNEYGMNLARMRDIETLVQLRRDQEGSREYMMFLYRYWTLCVHEDKEKSLQVTLELNQKLDKPLSEYEVKTATRSAERYFDSGKVFNPSNGHIIEALHITNDEMKKLSFFISAAKKKERKRQRNRKAYLANLESQGKQTKEEAVKRRYGHILNLLRRGKTPQEICSMLHISRSTYYGDKKVIDLLSEEELKALLGKISLPKPPVFHWFKKSIEMGDFCAVAKNPKNSALILYKSFRTMEIPCVPMARGAWRQLWDVFLRSCTAFGANYCFRF